MFLLPHRNTPVYGLHLLKTIVEKRGEGCSKSPFSTNCGLLVRIRIFLDQRSVMVQWKFCLCLCLSLCSLKIWEQNREKTLRDLGGWEEEGKGSRRKQTKLSGRKGKRGKEGDVSRG